MYIRMRRKGDWLLARYMRHPCPSAEPLDVHEKMSGDKTGKASADESRNHEDWQIENDLWRACDKDGDSDLSDVVEDGANHAEQPQAL